MAVVLVVDDEPLQAGILKTILEKGGYETHTASSGKEALVLVERLRPDVILTDLRMPRSTAWSCSAGRRQGVAHVPALITPRARHRRERGGGGQARRLRLPRSALRARA